MFASFMVKYSLNYARKSEIQTQRLFFVFCQKYWQYCLLLTWVSCKSCNEEESTVKSTEFELWSLQLRRTRVFPGQHTAADWARTIFHNVFADSRNSALCWWLRLDNMQFICTQNKTRVQHWRSHVFALVFKCDLKYLMPKHLVCCPDLWPPFIRQN